MSCTWCHKRLGHDDEYKCCQGCDRPYCRSLTPSDIAADFAGDETSADAGAGAGADYVDDSCATKCLIRDYEDPPLSTDCYECVACTVDLTKRKIVMDNDLIEFLLDRAGMTRDAAEAAYRKALPDVTCDGDGCTMVISRGCYPYHDSKTCRGCNGVFCTACGEKEGIWKADGDDIFDYNYIKLPCTRCVAEGTVPVYEGRRRIEKRKRGRVASEPAA